MRMRGLAAGVLGVVLLLGFSGPVPAQTRRVIKINLSSWKFEPNILKFNDGDGPPTG